MEFISDIYHRKLVDTYKEIGELYKTFHSLVGQLDRQINSLYHSLEEATEETLNAEVFTRELKGVLLRRRALKDEMARLKPFLGVGKYAANALQERYEGAVRVSQELRVQLNCTMTAEEVCAEMGVKLG
ncbi:hypothetical protein Q0N12_16370 [Rossellomorea marisflavi]|uniref:hypothetical protein n=1 Tax=Rossellomorea marisflavi TaxID=189381 RepID=UPI0034576AC2